MAQRFCSTDYVAAGTASSSADATGYPVANVQNAYRWKRWRSSTTNGNQNVDIDFGGSKTLTFVALVDVTAHPSGGTVKAQYWTGAAWSDLGTFTFSTVTGVGILWVNQATTKVRILFTNTGAVSSYVEIGSLRAGQYFQPARALGPGNSMRRTDPTQFATSLNGQEFAQQRTRYYEFLGTFEATSTTERDSFITLFETIGVFAPAFMAFDHTNMDRCLWGRFNAPLEPQHVRGASWTVPVSVQEVR